MTDRFIPISFSDKSLLNRGHGAGAVVRCSDRLALHEYKCVTLVFRLITAIPKTLL